MADCPNCQTPVPEPAGRFCDACGLALPIARRTAPKGKPEPIEVRCPECGLHAYSRRCRGCGAQVRWPEGMLPPDEQNDMPGKGADPALELDEGNELELGEAPEQGAPGNDELPPSGNEELPPSGGDDGF